jgi:asparagine synthase (glutamine-hydrolysing)
VGIYASAVRGEIVDADSDARHQAAFEKVGHADFLNQMLYLDTKIFMTSLNLTYNDKMSMACSVEVRVPFLDRELAEFVAWNVPPRMKLKGFFPPTTKHIFRKAMQGVLPDEVLRQPKAGFAAPTDYWLANDLRQMTDDLLSDSRLRGRGVFRAEGVQKLIAEHRSGRQDWSMQIWQFLTLELWMQNFVDRASGEASALASGVIGAWMNQESKQAAIA